MLSSVFNCLSLNAPGDSSFSNVGMHWSTMAHVLHNGFVLHCAPVSLEICTFSVNTYQRSLLTLDQKYFNLETKWMKLAESTQKDLQSLFFGEPQLIDWGRYLKCFARGYHVE